MPAPYDKRSEQSIQTSILLALQDLDGVKVWRQNTGTLRDRNGRPVSFGLPGAADISGCAGPEGWRLEIEVKRPGQKQSAQQKKFQAMIEALGGIYFVAHSPQEAVDVLHAELCKRRAGVAAPVCRNPRCRSLIDGAPVESKDGPFCSEKCRKSVWNARQYRGKKQ